MRTPRRTPSTRAQAPSPPPVRGRRAHAGPPADEGPMPPTGQAGTGAPRLRGPSGPRTVRAKIICLLMVPVVSLLALWGHATVTTAQDVSRLRQVQRADAAVRTPVAEAVTALQAERAAAVRRASDTAAVGDPEFTRLAQRTDRAVARLRLGDDRTVADGEALPRAVAERLDAFVTAAERLRPLRAEVREGRAGWARTYERYTAAIDGAFRVGGALTGVQDAELGSDARVLLEFARAGEALAREDAILAAARLHGSLGGERLRLFTGAVELRRTLTASAAPDLPGAARTAWDTLADGRPYAVLYTAEDKILAAGPGARAAEAVPRATWDAAHTRVRDELRTVERHAAASVAGRADPVERGLFGPAGAAVLFGLLAAAASLVISVRIGRGLVIELVGLRDDALDIAHRKLPEAMRKLRGGGEIDIRAEAPHGPPAQDETGQVAQALGTVHRAALRAAVERAELAGGISGVFVNLARRSQVLVHRQLSLLDSMERRSDDPDELSDLFRLDHLTTRMRRHAESLIILSGAAPGRAWRKPVPLTDVVRAAVSEVEDYARVEVRQLAETSVAGAAVADLTHLLAEIIENAAQFSPPHTRVRVTGEPVGNGYAVEVEDRGLGMGKEALAEANRRITESEALDLFDSDRLGLFVVSRLAARHAVKVHLKTSPYGGTTAVVLLPTALLDERAEQERPGTPAEAPAEGLPEPREPARARSGHVPRPRAVAAPDSRRALVAPVADPPPEPRPVAHPAPSVVPPGDGGAPPESRPAPRPVPRVAPGADVDGPPETRPAARSVPRVVSGADVDGPPESRPAPRSVPRVVSGADVDGPPETRHAPRPVPHVVPGADVEAPPESRSAPRSVPRVVPGADVDGPPESRSAPRPVPHADRSAPQAPRPAPHAVPRSDAGVESESRQGAATLRLHRTEEPAGSDDLPRRVRQASLAPQLRDGRPDAPGPTPGVGRADDRTPELVRDRMAAYRDGWTRGGGRPPGAARGTARPSTEGDPA
ncbi:sensor histidine kinase [Streptomyces althioticus]|uniref:sensor histidine kinase n=2 Tax=Streptomyces althioticus TaxID=83380 RepID=UPI00379D7E2F